MRSSAWFSREVAIRPELLIGLLFIAGCATVGQEFEQAQATWQGATYDEAVARWGPPVRSDSLPDGRQSHTWISQQPPVRAPGPSVGVGVFGGSGGRGGVGLGASFPFGGSVAAAPACERTLVFQDNQLVDQSWVGDPGYCRFFTR